MDHLHEVYSEIKELTRTRTSRVFLAENTRINAPVLIKQIFKTNDTNINTNLMAESEILINIRHHALPMILDVFEDEFNFYVAMEYIPGDTLQALLSRCGIIPEATVREYALQLCDVFSYLHNFKPYPIIYKDCKPSNIILDDVGHIYLIDFGIAKSRPDSEINAGTRGFSAPEQYDKNASTDVRTDIYGLGATIYCLLTGKTPEVSEASLVLANPEGRISEGMYMIIMKCLQQNPKNRYQSIEELSEAFYNIDSFSQKYRTLKRSKTIKIIVSAVCMVLFAIMFISGIIQCEKEKYESFCDGLQAGYELAKSGEQLAAAQMITSSIQMYPGKPEGYIALANLYIMRQDYDASLKVLTDAINRSGKLASDAQLNYYIGMTYYYLEDYATALKYFEKSIEADPLGTKYWRDLAVCYAKLNRFEEAIDILEQIQNEEKDFNGSYILAQIYEQLGELEKALGIYEECFNAPDSDLRVNAYIAAANVYDKSPKREDALECQIKILERAEQENLYQHRFKIRNLLGSCYYKKAEKLVDQEREYYLGLALDKYLLVKNEYVGTIDTYINISVIYQIMGRYTECEQILDEAFDIYYSDYRLFSRYALLELELQAKKTREERDYSHFKAYAMEAISLSPGENEFTELLKTYLRELNLN